MLLALKFSTSFGGRSTDLLEVAVWCEAENVLFYESG